MKILLISLLLISATSSKEALYKSLNPNSVIELLTFYELYPESEKGKEALNRAWQLLKCSKIDKEFFLPEIIDVQFFISLVNQKPFEPNIKLSEEKLTLISKLGKNLSNRNLKGFYKWKEEEILQLPPEEIDLARALFVSDGYDQKRTLYYEAILDLMALQILPTLPPNATALDKINAINDFIFHELKFCFPPHSLWAKNVDVYTFLPSVIDNRQGICLGISILYLCIAQRLDLKLEIVTPPGHIYVRYNDSTNIETTARGVNFPTETYLGIDTRKSELRNIKEVVGLSFMNQAASLWKKEKYNEAIKLYEKAKPYVPNDFLLKEFLAYNLLFNGQEKEGKALLEEIKGHTHDYAVSKETIAEDYLSGKTNSEGIKTIFLQVDENRESILSKQAKIKKILEKYPNFRAGLLQYAGTYMQLGRDKEALEILKRYYKIDPANAEINYYLAALSMDRYDYPSAWTFLKTAQDLTAKRDHHPKALTNLSKALKTLSPQI